MTELGSWFASGFIPEVNGKPDSGKIIPSDPELETILEMWDVLPD
jgi:hypothetical protein